MDLLPAAEADAAIADRIDELEAEIERWTAARPRKAPASWERDQLCASGIEHLRIDLRLLERLRARRAKSRA